MEIKMNKTGMFGNFDVLVPSGYTIFTYFTDYETKLLIVAIVPEDYKKLSPIPSKKYIIDPGIPKILLVDEWRQYFNFNEIKLVNEDENIKLISQNYYNEHDKNIYKRLKIVDLNTGEILDKSEHSYSFNEWDKNKEVMDTFIRIREMKKERQKFLSETFSHSSKDEKIDHYVWSIWMQFRYDMEMPGHYKNPAIPFFNKLNYENWKKYDRDIDDTFRIVAKGFGISQKAMEKMVKLSDTTKEWEDIAKKVDEQELEIDPDFAIM